MELVLIGLVVFSVVLVVWINIAQSGQLPQPNTRAPELELPSHTGETKSLSGTQGQWRLLFFYPQDDTPECVAAINTLQAAGGELDGINAWFIAVASTQACADYAAKHHVALPILADESGKVCKRFGTLTNFGGYKLARKAIVLVDPRGVVAESRPILDSVAHVNASLASLKKYRVIA